MEKQLVKNAWPLVYILNIYQKIFHHFYEQEQLQNNKQMVIAPPLYEVHLFWSFIFIVVVPLVYKNIKKIRLPS